MRRKGHFMRYGRKGNRHTASLMNEISVRSTSLGFRTVEAVDVNSEYSPELHELTREPRSNLIRHISNISVPDHGGIHRYRYRASGYRIGNIAYAVHYSDEITGISGGMDRQNGIIAKFILSGELRLESGKESLVAKPGQACIFDTQRPWKFWKSNNTRYRWIAIPGSYLYRNIKGLNLADRPAIADNSKPEVQIAISFLQMLKSQNLHSLTASGHVSTEEAASSLLSSVVTGATPVASSREFDNVTVSIAQSFIDKNLQSPELNPATIAKAISVSLRSLHRAFSSAGISVMGYVRMRRIQEARNDLLEHGRVSVSEIAAKWKFSDASHFIRQFKELYGTTPASYVKSLEAVMRSE